jgi:hypothetical protein
MAKVTKKALQQEARRVFGPGAYAYCYEDREHEVDGSFWYKASAHPSTSRGAPRAELFCHGRTEGIALYNLITVLGTLASVEAVKATLPAEAA